MWDVKPYSVQLNSNVI